MTKKEEQDEDKTYNVFRDSLLRYAGYANEIGESFRYQFPKLVTPSYVVAFGYCFADAATTGWATWNDDAGSRSSEDAAAGDADDAKKSVTPMHPARRPTNNEPHRHQPALSLPSSSEATSSAGMLALRATVDTLIWQSLASVMIPGATINLIVKASRLAVQTANRSKVVLLPATVTTWFPTAAGLGSIPIIIKPIDASVDVLLDHTIRKWW